MAAGALSGVGMASTGPENSTAGGVLALSTLSAGPEPEARDFFTASTGEATRHDNLSPALIFSSFLSRVFPGFKPRVTLSLAWRRVRKTNLNIGATTRLDSLTH